MKRLTKILAVLAVMLAMSSVTQAAVSDALTITITPNANYAIAIDTTNVGLNLGTVALGASTQTIRPSTITINSTFATTDVKIQGAIASGGTPWTFDSNTASQEANALAAWATFTSVARSSAPTVSGDYFSGTVPGAAASDVLDTSNRYVGSSVSDGTTNLFENNSNFDSQDMDSLVPSTKAHVWFYFRLPSATTSNLAQNITITLTAVAPN